MNKYIEKTLDTLKKKNSNAPEFIQAAEEMMITVKDN